MKNPIKILMLCLIAIMFSSCMVNHTRHRYRSCPINDKLFFYKQMGVKAPKAFKKMEK